MDKLKTAIQAAGGISAVARLLGVTPQRLSNWIERGVPAEQCPVIERALNGSVRCEDMRPDVPWDVLRKAPVEEAVTQSGAL